MNKRSVMNWNHYPHTKRSIALGLLLLFILELVTPTAVYALTSGPTQPEVHAFTPVGASNLVDITSGNFSYNIPLFEVPGPEGGYPLNLAYQAGIGLDQEASWTGLGWNLNPGTLTRQMRGLPDEFNGSEKMTQTTDMKENVTVGVEAKLGGLNLKGLEFFGKVIGREKNKKNVKEIVTRRSYIPYLNVSLGFTYNNYIGGGVVMGVGLRPSRIITQNVSNDDTKSGKEVKKIDGILQKVSLGVKLDNMNGPSTSLEGQLQYGSYSINGNINYNRRQNQYQLSLNAAKTTSIKKKIQRYSGANISYMPIDYIPYVPQDKTGISFNITPKMGGAALGNFLNVTLTATYHKTALKYRNQAVQTPAYGYLYTHQAHTVEGGDVVMDYNQYKNNGDVKSDFLPIPVATHDIYSVQGQGFSAMFRPYRSEIGTYQQRQTQTVTGSKNIGPEVGITSDQHLGFPLSSTHVNNTAQAWNDPHVLKFEGQQGSVGHEPFYYQVYSESTPIKEKEGHWEAIKEANPVRMDFRGVKGNNPLNQNKQHQHHRVSIGKGERVARSTVIQAVKNKYLRTAQMPAGFDVFGMNRQDKILYPDHHPGGFVALTPTGTRYVYGVPLYNRTQEEYSFSVSDNDRNNKNDNNPAHYKSYNEIDNRGQKALDYAFSVEGNQPHYKDSKKSKENPQTRSDEFYQKREVPAYAHSYLLTSILSPDYIDVNGQGADDQDIGGWVNFTYQQMYKGSSNHVTGDDAYYHWRAPYYKADLNYNLESKDGDDKGSFVYGKKEIRYLRQIETASHVAYFYLKARKDSRGAKEALQNGLIREEQSDGQVKYFTYQNNKRQEVTSEDDYKALLGKQLYALDKIVLYSKEELKAHKEYEIFKNRMNGVLTGTKQDLPDPDQMNTAPITTVHFEYTYELCRGVPNHENYWGYLQFLDAVQKKGKAEAKTFVEQYNKSGKLTLKKVYFTYGKNKRGSLTPYEFDYGAKESWTPQYINGQDVWSTKIYKKGATGKGSIHLTQSPLPGNPHYARGCYDMWGNYQANKLEQTGLLNKEHPYLQQYADIDISLHKIQDPTLNAPDDWLANEAYKQRSTLDEYAGAWALKRINLPSSAEILVGYEADDYAYVQNKKAMSFLPVVGVSSYHKDAKSQEDHEVKLRHSSFDKEDINGDGQVDGLIKYNPKNTYRVYFKLPQPISVNTTEPQRKLQLNQYIDGVNQIYFKVRTELKNNLHETVRGYAQLNTDTDKGIHLYKEKKITIETNGGTQEYYPYAYIDLQPERGDDKIGYHPFAVAAWQFIQQVRPDIIYKDIKQGGAISMAKSVSSFFGQYRALLNGYFRYAYKKSQKDASVFGTKIDLKQSFIRLNVPTGTKVGGGHRVRYVIHRNNELGNEGFYGSIYHYDTQENGHAISSGVATFEPALGGEENPLRVANRYNSFLIRERVFEMPLNEAYFPAPEVGYTRVTTESLASFVKRYGYNGDTDNLGRPKYNDESKIEPLSLLYEQLRAHHHTDDNSQEGIVEKIQTFFPENAEDRKYGTTGITTHEFYSCREYPTVIRHTKKLKQIPHWAWNGFTLFGVSIQHKNYKFSQGYTIELNDMHMKPRKVTQYGQKQDGSTIDAKISEVEYLYETDEYQAMTQASVGSPDVKIPNNKVEVLVSENGKEAVTEKDYLLGHSYEVFADAQKITQITIGGGVNMNIETLTSTGGVSIPIPIPNIQHQKNVSYIHVTNKVVHRKGVLRKVITTDGTSTSEAENILWDKLTGNVVLTKVTNNFGDPIYSYTIPAHRLVKQKDPEKQVYAGMGGAYKNVGLYLEDKILQRQKKQIYNTYNITVNLTDLSMPINNYISKNELDQKLNIDKGIVFRGVQDAQGNPVGDTKGTITQIDNVITDPTDNMIQWVTIRVKFDDAIILGSPSTISWYLDGFNKLTGDIKAIEPVGKVKLWYDIALNKAERDLLALGDEFILTQSADPTTGTQGVVQQIATTPNPHNNKYWVTLALKTFISDGQYNFYLYRSGRRNLLQASVGSIVGMENPTKNRGKISNQKEYLIPPCDNCNTKLDCDK